ncbi:class I SAM-dependent methyltransferase [Litchfieldia salsa]|uniref:Methyltransferase domain-containing protein n=1 Tax=Litchfieldia salsa TaxID=930152 RepID=A0A1H0WYY8_9BACI|nr:class I SAM-dependent methyltransferase [Litchfieldia salsa]SDP95456.1 Methyltransferase domain-containing protein [Litchfieldia salsa]
MDQKSFNQLIEKYGIFLEKANIPYQYIDQTALRIQGVQVNAKQHQQVNILIQWDLLDTAYNLFDSYTPSDIKRDQLQAMFMFVDSGYDIKIHCSFNTTIKTDPYRIKVSVGNIEVWCRSLYSYLYEVNPSYVGEIETYLQEKQRDLNSINEQAWNQNNYQALLNRFGSPEETAKKIKENPDWRLHPFRKYLGDLSSKKVIHLLGSNGVKGTAIALLGGEVTIVDFSMENQRFAEEVSGHAGVSINYILSDVMSLNKHSLATFDIVLMELGVLHYFIDLPSLASIVSELLEPNGVFILHEFHPISTKLITSSGKKHKVDGNYFDPSLVTLDVAFSKHLTEEEKKDLAKVYQRQWNIGEVITTFAKKGIYVDVLEEEPNHKVHDIGLPKTYTLVARRV